VPFGPPNLNGEINPPSGNTGGGSGGGSGPGSNPVIDLSNVTSTGGLDGIDGVVLTFGLSEFFPQAVGWKFDAEDFNCEEDCEYHFRIEEIEPYRQPTVDSIIIRYRDLGKVTVNAFIIGNVLGESKVSKIVVVTFGGKADKKIYTVKFDLTCTFEAPQLIIERDALKGPLSITKILMEIIEGDARPI
jgi:hypothetical protein